MRKNVFPLYKTMVEIRQKHIFLRFFSEKHLLLTADWSHLCRSRSERRTANLTTTKIRQISLGKVGKIQLSWATPKSWKKGKKTQIHKTKRLQHWYSNKHFFSHGIWFVLFLLFRESPGNSPSSFTSSRCWTQNKLAPGSYKYVFKQTRVMADSRTTKECYSSWNIKNTHNEAGLGSGWSSGTSVIS